MLLLGVIEAKKASILHIGDLLTQAGQLVR